VTLLKFKASLSRIGAGTFIEPILRLILLGARRIAAFFLSAASATLRETSDSNYLIKPSRPHFLAQRRRGRREIAPKAATAAIPPSYWAHVKKELQQDKRNLSLTIPLCSVKLNT
jgi:hypothetical protein